MSFTERVRLGRHVIFQIILNLFLTGNTLNKPQKCLIFLMRHDIHVRHL